MSTCLLKANRRNGLSRPIFYAVGGGWRAFARVHLASSAASLQVVNGYAIDARGARAFAKTISRLSKREVATLPGIPASRIATLPAAALVMDRVACAAIDRPAPTGPALLVFEDQSTHSIIFAARRRLATLRLGWPVAASITPTIERWSHEGLLQSGRSWRGSKRKRQSLLTQKCPLVSHFRSARRMQPTGKTHR